MTIQINSDEKVIHCKSDQLYFLVKFYGEISNNDSLIDHASAER